MRQITITLGLIVLQAAFSLGTGLAAEKPNFILLMADDQGWGDAGYQGHPHLKTPALDKMAADGMRFNRFYAGAPVCSPTRGSALTGRHPYRYGVFFANTGHLLPREITIAELLKPQGYITGHFGKWHLGTLTRSIPDSNRGGLKNTQHYSPPNANGFDVNFSTEAKTPTYDPYFRPKTSNSKKWWDPVGNNIANAAAYGTHYWRLGTRVEGPLRGDDSKLIMDRAIEFIRKTTAAKRPFFAVVWFHAPHLPVVASDEDRQPYLKHSKYKQHYFGCMAALDRQVGRLRDELEALQINDDTMLCYCSDNGPEGNATAPGSTNGLRGRKRSLYEGGIRVPGLAVWPGHIRPGSVTDTPASTADYLPTVAEALRIPIPGGRPIDGRSLLSVFANPSGERETGIGFQSGQQVAWIENRYKIYAKGVVAKTGSGTDRQGKVPRFELYDLISDPKESKDLAEQEPEVLARLIARLQSWRESCRKSLAEGP